MTKELTCIGCPMGCSITVEVGRAVADGVERDVALSVKGNTCGIGKKYAEQEIAAPMRMVTSTAITSGGIPVPVKTASSVPKGSIFDVMKDIKSARPVLPVRTGDVIVENAADTGVAVIATKDVSA